MPAMFPVADAEPEVQIPSGPPFTGDTAEYVVLMAGRAVGRLRQWPDTVGSTTTSFSYTDRGRGPTLTQTLRLDKAGLPVAMQLSGTSDLKIAVRETLRMGDLIESMLGKSTLERFLRLDVAVGKQA